MIRTRKNKAGTSYQVRTKLKGSIVSKSFASYREAEKWLNEVRFKRDQGKKIFTEPVTVQAMFSAYLAHAQEVGLAPGTIKTAESRFNYHILPGYGRDLDITTVTKEEHREFLRMLQFKKTGESKVISPASRNRIRTLMRRLFSLAIRNELFGGAFKANPFDSIPPAREPKKTIHYLNREEMKLLLEKNRHSPYYALLLLLLKTGLRIGEAVAVHSEQIDFYSQMLTVDRQFDSSVNRVLHSTKSKKIRMIYLVDELAETLKPLPPGPLFRNPNGSEVTPNYFLKFILPKACAVAGIKKINPHATRHTFAAHYMMNGGQLWDLSKILGHSETRITEERYGHFDLEHMKQRMRVVEREGNVLRARFG